MGWKFQIFTSYFPRCENFFWSFKKIFSKVFILSGRDSDANQDKNDVNFVWFPKWCSFLFHTVNMNICIKTCVYNCVTLSTYFTGMLGTVCALKIDGRKRYQLLWILLLNVVYRVTYVLYFKICLNGQKHVHNWTSHIQRLKQSYYVKLRAD